MTSVVSIKIYSQNDTIRNITFAIDKDSLSMVELLNSIESKTECDLSYSPDYINSSSIVQSISGNSTLGDYLDLIEKSQKLKIIINGNQIYLINNKSKNDQISKNVTLSGFVKDFNTGEVLIGASIRGEGTLYGQLSDENGYFNLKTKNNINKYVISYIGYTPFEINRNDLLKTIQSDFYLKKSILLDEIIIKDKHSGGELGLFEYERIKSTFEISDNKAGVRGNDLFDQIIALPGIEKVNDFQGGVSINGLSPNDNIYLLDGVRIYEPNHIFGLFSTFNSSSINKVSIHTNTIPSKYSGVLSAVIDNHLKEGNFKKQSFNFDLTNTDLGLHFSGPFIKYKTSYILDIRKSILGAYIPDLIKKQTDLDFNKIDFYDVNLKITHRIGSGNKLSLFYYFGKDEIIIKNDFEAKLKSENNFSWINRAIGMNWNYLISNNFKSDFNLSLSNYSNNSFSGFNIQDNANDDKYLYLLSYTNVQDISLRQEFSYYFPNSTLRVGYNVSKFDILPSLRGNISDVSDIPDLQIESEADSTYNDDIAHINYEYKALNRFKFTFGMQYGIYRKNSFSDNYFNPQLVISYKLGGFSYLDFTYQQSTKFIHSLGSYSIGIPSMLWIGSEESIPMSQIENFSINYILEKSKFGLKAEVYYKRLSDLILFKDLTDIYNPISSKGIVVPLFNTSSSFSKDIIIGSGIAYGFNFNSKLRFSNIQADFSFSVNRNRLKFDDINLGNEFNAKYDMLYSNGVSFKYIKSNYKLFVDWHLHSGQVFTFPEYIYKDEGGNEILDYSQRNNRRMKSYQSLSLGFEYELDYEFVDFVISGGVNNIYNHFNPVYVYLYQSENVYKASQLSGIPIFPYLKLQFKF